MIADLKSWWNFVSEFRDEASESPALPIDAEQLRDPFSQLPPVRDLTPQQRSWLKADLTLPHSMLTLMKYQRAASIRGPSAESHGKRRERLDALAIEANELGYQLPADFVTLLSDDQMVNRMRFGCHWFELPDFICPCPLDESLVMVLFLCEAQGCDYTHLLLNRDGRHCVTRTMHWYGKHPMPPGADSTDEEKQIFHYADSFAEYICLTSDEIRQGELVGARRRMELADEAVDAGELEGAIEMYQLALSYDPDSKEIAPRIANCEKRIRDR